MERDKKASVIIFHQWLLIRPDGDKYSGQGLAVLLSLSISCASSWEGPLGGRTLNSSWGPKGGQATAGGTVRGHIQVWAGGTVLRVQQGLLSPLWANAWLHLPTRAPFLLKTCSPGRLGGSVG